MPKCLCILSRHPFFNTFKLLLSFLYTTYVSNNLDESESIERILDNFMFEVPMSASPCTQVSFKIGAELRRLSTNPFQPDFPLEPLFHVLTMDNIAKILGWICTERTIIFVSQNAYLLGLVMQSLLWLLRPVKWCHPFIPLLPPGFEYLLQSPHPLLVGVCGSDLQATFTSNDDVVAVYLDDNQIVTTLPKDPYPFPGRIADALKRAMKEQLTKLAPNNKHPSLLTLGKAFQYEQLPQADAQIAAISSAAADPPVLDPFRIKSSFINLTQELVGNYEKYAREEPKEQGKLSGAPPVLLFDQEGYCASKEPKERAFFLRFTQTQLFEQYGEQLGSASVHDRYLIEIMDSLAKTKAPPGLGTILIQQSVTAPDPDYCMGKRSKLIKHVLSRSETFPAQLNNSLFLNSQSIPWENLRLEYEEDLHEDRSRNPLATTPTVESLMKLNFAKAFVEYMQKYEARAKKFWRISRRRNSSQPNSGSRSLSSRNNNKPRSVSLCDCDAFRLMPTSVQGS